MNNLKITAVIAFASMALIGGQSQAANMHKPRHETHHQKCVVKPVKHMVHGHVVIKKERVCR
jgi:hypothetical protein